MNLFKCWAVLILGAAQLTAGKSVTGTVKLEGGGAAVGVRVMAVVAPGIGRGPSGTSILASLTQTDKDGRYRLENIPPGRYFIAAGPIDYPTFYPGTALQNEARVVTITQDDASLSEINFSVGSAAAKPAPPNSNYPPSPCCNLSGLLLTEDGKPLPPVPLKVVETGSSSRVAVDDGFFRFFLPQGTIAQLAVDGFPPGYSLTSVIYGGTNVGQKFLVDGRESLLLMIRVQPGATLPTVTARGKVENLARELNGANLSLVLTATLSGGPRVLAPVQPDHSFEFVNIPIGSYRAGIQSAQSVWRSVTVVVIRDAVSDLKIDFGDDPFPDWDVANLSAPSPFSDGKTITITGVATQKLTRYRPAGKSAYFRMNVKDEATGVVRPWAIHITDEGLVPNIAVGETYTLTGSAAADGSNRLKAQPF